MKFQKLENIYLKTETKNYFTKIIDFNKYYLYFGVIEEYFGFLLSKNEIVDEYLIDSSTKIVFNNKNYEYSDLTTLLQQLESINDKSIEIFTLYSYIKFPVSMDFIDWLKAESEIFTETPEIYKKISLPYINSILDKNTKWIRDLVYNQSEENLMFFRNDLFVICKDIVWKDNNPNNFYILAIPVKNIKNIRHLNADHLSLLKEMQNQIIDIAFTFGIKKERLYMFFHYHPSYYFLHLHACVIDNDILETKYHRHYFLDDIIENITSDSEYYKNQTLKFELSTSNKLYKLLKEQS